MWAEDDELGARARAGRMTRRSVEGVAATDDLLAIAVPEPHAAARHNTPVRAGAPVTGQSAQQLREVGIGAAVLS